MYETNIQIGYVKQFQSLVIPHEIYNVDGGLQFVLI